MPKRQLLLGIWLLATGLVSFTALILGVLLDAQLVHDAQSRILLWITVAL